MTSDHRSATRWVFPTALLGSAWIVGLTVLGGLGFPGYDHVSQYISELGARQAPQEMLIRFSGFLPGGLLLILFAGTASRSLTRSRLGRAGFFGLGLFALGYLVAVVFPCDPGCRPVEPSLSQMIHNLGGLAGYLFVAPALIALGIDARRWPAPRLSVLAFVLAVTAFVGFVGLDPESPFGGASQRILEASTLLWIVACGFHARGLASRREG